MALRTRADPVAFRSTGGCSSVELTKHGASLGHRTRNLLVNGQALLPVELETQSGTGGNRTPKAGAARLQRVDLTYGRAVP